MLMPARPKKEDLAVLKEFIEAGKVTPVIVSSRPYDKSSVDPALSPHTCNYYE
jgi:hypothetical protein